MNARPSRSWANVDLDGLLGLADAQAAAAASRAASAATTAA